MTNESAATTPPAATPANARHQEWASGAVIAAVFLAMLGLSWGKWAHPIIDFGREIYVTWRLHEGDRLYDSLAHFYSPLSPYVNTIWFWAFGASFRSLVLGNIIVLVGTLALLHGLLRRLASLFAATTATVVVVIVLAFGKYQSVGDFGYVTPYAHELTHGLLLSLAMLLALASYYETRRAGALALAGALLGLTFLTKYEVFAAAMGAAVLGLLAFFAARREFPSRAQGVAFVAGLVAPFGICWLLLSTYLGPVEALRGALGPYPYLWDPQLATSGFYRGTMGLDDPLRRIGGMAAWLTFYAAVTLPMAFVGRSDQPDDSRRFGLLAISLPPLGYAAARGVLVFRQSIYPLPFALAAALVALALAGRSPERGSDPAHATRLTAVAFALLLMARVFLNPTLSHYALVLAFPGLALAVVALAESIPAWLDRRGLQGAHFRQAALSLLVVFVAAHLSVSTSIYNSRRFTVGTGPDTFKADEMGVVVSKAVDLVERHTSRNETLAVFPEGAMVNYLTRRKSSSPHVLFEPGYLSSLGEDAVLDTLVRRPPDWVLAFTREVRALDGIDCPVFGQDCAQRLGSWLKQNYTPRIVVSVPGRRLFTLLKRATPGATPEGPEFIELRSGR